MWIPVIAAALPAAWAGEHEGEARIRFAVYGGSEGSGPAHRAVVAQMVKAQPDLVLHAGGLVADAHREDAWQAFDELTRPLRAVGRLYPCCGKHEAGGLYESRFRFPESSSGSKLYYSFDHKGIHFISLDSNPAITRDDEQTGWLERDLAAAAARPAFVICQEPMLSVAGKSARGGAQVFWHPLFARHKVRAVFSGGHHLYYRTVQDGVAYIITGGGGAPLDAVMARRTLQPSDVAASFHHFIEMTVSGGQVRGRVVDDEGKTRDEFSIPPAP